MSFLAFLPSVLAQANLPPPDPADVTIVTDAPAAEPANSEAPRPAPTPPAPAPGASHRATRVHIDSSSPVTLELHDDSDPHQAYVPVCTSPCDTFVPAGDYRVAGDGIRASRSFPLGDTPQVTLWTQPKSQTAFVGGLFLAGAGAATVVGTYAWRLFASMQGNIVTPEENTIGIVVAIAGATAAVGGLTLTLLNLRSYVSDVSPQSVGAPSGLPFPTWRDASAPLQVAPPLTVPVAFGTF